MQAAVTFIRSHSAAQNAVMRMQSEDARRRSALMFKVSNDTRWNSTLYMLQRYLQLCPAVQKLLGALEGAEENPIPGLLEVLPSEEVIAQVRSCMPVCIHCCRCCVVVLLFLNCADPSGT